MSLRRTVLVRFYLLMLIVLSVGLPACISAYKQMVSSEQDLVQSRVYKAEYNLCWDAVVEALKTNPMEAVNRETGMVQTKWIDNTAERNQAEAHDGVVPYVKARYRIRVSLNKGIFDGQAAVKVSVQKEQQYQRDVLEDWKYQPTDTIQENAILYRIGKLISLKSKLKKAEDEKLKKEMNGTNFSTSD